MKRGKREAKVPRKRVTLQNYLLSLLSMTLSCALFLSVTTAWFNSQVTSGGSRISSGSVNVDLRDEDGSLQGREGKLFDEVYYTQAGTGEGGAADRTVVQPSADAPPWQPGAFAYETLQVVNQGNLPFTYDLSLTAAKKEEDGSFTEIQNLPDIEPATEDWENLSIVGKYFTVWVREEETAAEKAIPAVDADVEKAQEIYDEIIAAQLDPSGDWTRVGDKTNPDSAAPGTLTYVLSKTEQEYTAADGTAAKTVRSVPVFEGTVTAQEIQAASENPAGLFNGAKPVTRTYTVVLYMDPDAPSAVLVQEDGTVTEGYTQSAAAAVSPGAGAENDPSIVFKDKGHNKVEPKTGDKIISIANYPDLYLNARLVATQQGAELAPPTSAGGATGDTAPDTPVVP